MPKVGSVGRLDGGSSTSDVHVIFGDPNHCVDDNNSPTIRDPLHDQSTDLRTERSPDSAATIRAAAIAANQSDESLSKHSAAIDNLQKQMEELKKKLSSSLEDHKVSMEEFYKKFCEHFNARADDRSVRNPADIDNNPDSSPESTNHSLVTTNKALLEEIAELKKNKALREQLGELKKNNAAGSNNTLGQEKVLAGSIKKMFKGMGLLSASGLTLLGGIGLLAAVCTFQIYAIPVFALMTGIGYAGVTMIAASESEENTHAEAKAA